MVVRAGLSVLDAKKKSDRNKFMSKEDTNNKVEGNEGIKMFGNVLMLRANEGDVS